MYFNLIWIVWLNLLLGLVIWVLNMWWCDIMLVFGWLINLCVWVMWCCVMRCVFMVMLCVLIFGVMRCGFCSCKFLWIVWVWLLWCWFVFIRLCLMKFWLCMMNWICCLVLLNLSLVVVLGGIMVWRILLYIWLCNSFGGCGWVLVICVICCCLVWYCLVSMMLLILCLKYFVRKSRILLIVLLIRVWMCCLNWLLVMLRRLWCVCILCVDLLILRRLLWYCLLNWFYVLLCWWVWCLVWWLVCWCKCRCIVVVRMVRWFILIIFVVGVFSLCWWLIIYLVLLIKRLFVNVLVLKLLKCSRWKLCVVKCRLWKMFVKFRWLCRWLNRYVVSNGREWWLCRKVFDIVIVFMWGCCCIWCYICNFIWCWCWLFVNFLCWLWVCCVNLVMVWSCLCKYYWCLYWLCCVYCICIICIIVLFVNWVMCMKDWKICCWFNRCVVNKMVGINEKRWLKLFFFCVYVVCGGVEVSWVYFCINCLCVFLWVGFLGM